MKLTFIFLALFALTHLANAQPVTIYVSPKGNDQNTGKSANVTLATVQKALNNWAAIKTSGNPISDASILLEGGTYQLGEPIRITPENGGSANSKLIIRSADNQKALFNGAKKISG